MNDLLETRAGSYWIATDGGLCRFNPTEESGPKRNEKALIANGANTAQMFTTFNPHDDKATTFNVLVEDDQGAIWCGTSEGLYKVDVSPEGNAQFHFVPLEKLFRTAERDLRSQRSHGQVVVRH